MASSENRQWIRKAGLFVSTKPVVSDLPLALDNELNKATGDVGRLGFDLSEMRIRFDVQTADKESPNNAAIRIYNLSEDTMRRVRGEYNRVTLQAGYEDGYGIIFDGTIKQFRIGKENATDKFLDIFAADGDLGYNHGFVNRTFAAGTSSKDIAEYAARAMGLVLAHIPTNHFTFPRGKVLFGLGRSVLSSLATTMGATWSIQNGRVQMIPLDGYLPGEAVEINSATGMIGIPEQTDQGICVRTLLNPRLRIGGLIKLNNNAINRMQLLELSPFNHHKGVVQSAPLSGDGLYRVLVVEHIGDTRGQEWYSDIIALAVNTAEKRVVAGA